MHNDNLLIQWAMLIKVRLWRLDLAERIFRDEVDNFVDTTSNIRDMLKEDSRLALCINRIVKLIEDRYDYKLSPDEQTYLCIHIKKNMKQL